MLKRITLPLGGLLLLLACTLPALAADPSPGQVYEAARGGNLAEAQQMITQVLRDHPQSGQAHYVAAEIDARAGNYGLARQELQTAESLEPGLPFAKPSSVRELQVQLGEVAGGGAVARQPVRHSPRYGLFLILIAGAVILWLVLRRRAMAMGYPGSVGPGGMPPGGYAPGYGPGYGQGYGPGGYPPGYMPGGGSGIMGSVASGLALGAGVAAGEELVEHMMGGSNTGGGGLVPPAQAEPLPDSNANMGGNDFGLNDPGSWDGGGGGGGWDDGAGGGGDGGGGWT